MNKVVSIFFSISSNFLEQKIKDFLETEQFMVISSSNKIFRAYRFQDLDAKDLQQK